MTLNKIRLRGVKVHNLKNVDIDLPRGNLVAVCGVSGSGKTSLAIDTLYAEGQRRYIESFSAYTRQFLERLDKPSYDRIDGIPPALAVRRQSAPRGNRSTVGSVSETIEYLRLLHSKLAMLHCHGCGQSVESYSPQSIARIIHALPAAAKVMVTFRAHWKDVAERAAVLADMQASGFLRVIADNRLLHLSDTARSDLAKQLSRRGDALVVVDRLRGGDDSGRSTESIETAFQQGYGELSLVVDSSDEVETAAKKAGLRRAEIEIDGQSLLLFSLSSRLCCATCAIEYPAPEPRLFSFNSPLGACATCEGFGDTIDLDWDLIVPDPNLSIRDGAIAPWNSPAYSHWLDELLDIADDLDIPVDLPFSKLKKAHIKKIRLGSTADGFGGLDGFFAWLERKKYKMHVRVFLSRWRSYNRCVDCGGQRLSREALSYRLEQLNFAELCGLKVQDLLESLESLRLTDSQRERSQVPLTQVIGRLKYLDAVGLGYLSLDRTMRTLSGGEAQRTALTSALGSGLVDILYVLDEPSVGLHPHDVQRLSSAIRNLVDRGNTVVTIEHEEAVLEQADWLIEVGPEAGARGGEIVVAGPPDEIPDGVSLTLDYVRGGRTVPLPLRRRSPEAGWIEITGCRGHNLKDVNARFPLGLLTVVTGVSGSGKSSLVQETLYAALANRFTKSRVPTLPFENILGSGQIDECVYVDQSPVSRSPRSNPVTYVKAFDEIRSVFADTVEAKTRNFTSGHFSFNSELGRCQHCGGDGVLQVDMQFLADITIVCPDCRGRRYRSEILRVKYRDQSIADVLQMTIEEASHFFRGAKKVQQKLQVLIDVGLGYLQLGQSATTLSSGEAQRLKLANQLASANRKRCLFVLDEPTTGLHTHDLLRLLDCFNALLNAGHTLVVVEHNLHIVAAADWVIDIGPGPAHLGGAIVAEGTPEMVAGNSESVTGQWLADYFSKTVAHQRATAAS